MALVIQRFRSFAKNCQPNDMIDSVPLSRNDGPRLGYCVESVVDVDIGREWSSLSEGPRHFASYKPSRPF